MENYCTSLELSQKLRALEVPQKSVFYWISHAESDSYFIERKDFLSEDGMSLLICSAFLSDELGRMLPDFKLERWRKTKENRYGVQYPGGEITHSVGVGDFLQSDKRMVDAMAKQLILLIEQGHVKASTLSISEKG